MKNAGNKRLILILLSFALLICSGVALGNTFASQVNTKDQGEALAPEDNDYNVVVTYHDGTGYNRVLTDAAPVLTNDIIWCPGYTKIIYFKLTNAEAFPVECTLKMTAKNSDLNSALTYALLGDLQPASDGHPQSWKEVTAEKVQLTTDPVTIINRATLVGTDAQYCAIAIHMDENAGNQYLNKSVDVDFQLIINANYKPGVIPTSAD